MISEFDIQRFINFIKDKEKGDIISAVDKEVREAESNAARMKRYAGGIVYSDLLRGLAAFIHFEQKPLGVEEPEFQLFKPVCQALISKGKMNPETLKLFKDSNKKIICIYNKVLEY